MFKIFDTGVNTYECRLTTRALVEAEVLLKTNPVNKIMPTEGLPALGDLLMILWVSMKDMNHGVKRDDIYGIFDDYVANGGDFSSLLEFIMELFMDSGVLGKEKADEETGEKN